MKAIPGFEGYFADEGGGIYSTNRSKYNPGGKYYKMTQSMCSDKYLAVSLVNNGKQITKKVHRLVLLAFKGFPPNDKSVCRHLDGNRYNNAPSNLEWGTVKENIADTKLHGTFSPPPRHEKLQLSDIDKIREMLLCGAPQKEIAAKFKIDASTISRINTGKRWGNNGLARNN